MKKLIFALLLSACAGPAQSQSVQQSGNVTPGHVASWITNGVVGDGGAPGGPIFTGSTTTNDFACAGASGTIIDCGLSAVGVNSWTGLQNFNGGATAPTRALGDNTTNVATTAYIAAGGYISGGGTSVVGNVVLYNNTLGTAFKDSGGGAASIPITHPSSGNLSGAGCNPSQAHSLWWVDQNLCSTADVWQITSNDPSAVFTATLSGSRTTGDKITLNFTFGSGTCVAGVSPACDASYTAIAGDTLQNIANGIVCSIANNTNLFALNGGSCAAGVVSAGSGNTSFGGYASGAIIGYAVQITNGIAFDFNSNIALKVTSSVTGAATEIVTIGNTNCGIRCSYPLDNNPAFQMERISGAAPQPGSVLNAIYALGSTSACPTTACVNYGVLANWVGNSTAASIQSAWLLQTPNTSGTLNGGLWVGQGAYSNFGGSPFSSTALQDKGTGTFNLGTCLWFNSTSARDATITDSICQSTGAGQLQIVTTGTDNIIISSSAGVGVNTTPTGNAFVSNLGGFFVGVQTPTTGSGISLAGGTTPIITFENYGTSTFLAGSLAALSWDFKPSASATSGWTLSANKLAPDTDNATQIGDGTHNVSTVFAKAISGLTTPLSIGQGGTGDSGTAWTAFTSSPSCGTATFTVNSARAKTLGKTTWIQADIVITAIGTCGVTNLVFTLPNTTNSSGALIGREQVNSNKGIDCVLLAAGTTASCLRTDDTTWLVNDRMVVSGVYENQ